MRVVSLLPSATEIVCALGHRADLVGRSAECDYPLSVRSLPVVMRPRTWDADAPSRTIDERVRAVRSDGESLYELDLDRLRQLEPEIVLTQDLCGVCSVTDREVEEACRIADVSPRIVSLTPRTLDEVWTSVETVARALGDPAAGSRLRRRLRDRARPSRPRAGLRVAVVEWLDPPILAGLWAPDQVRAAGAFAIGPGPGEVGMRTTWEDLRRATPDLLVLSPCSFSVERSRRELDVPRLASLVDRVAAPGGTFVADEANFSRPGPRLADGVDLLRALVGGAADPLPEGVWRRPSAPLRIPA